jgi:peptidoglycan/LPS O-acetylase OafA/YrhL
LALTRHYTTLDGMRGIAAIAVVAFHCKDMWGGLYPRSAYLAVDLFFALSGFVIAHAYERRLSAGLSFRAFLGIRLLRLYPLYLAGTLLTAAWVTLALFVKHDTSTWTAGPFSTALPLALLMLPAPALVYIFPLNAPAWSLFYEMIVSAFYTSAGFRKNTILCAVIAVSMGGLIVQTVAFGQLDQGAYWSSSFWAVFRVFFSFPLGVMLYRVHDRFDGYRLPTLALMAILAVAMFAPPSIDFRGPFDLAFVLLISPILVLLGSASAPEGRFLSRIYKTLGLISYPIYVLQFPIITFAFRWARRLPGSLQTAWSGAALLAVLIVIAYVAGTIDAALRRRLMRQPARNGITQALREPAA